MTRSRRQMKTNSAELAELDEKDDAMEEEEDMDAEDSDIDSNEESSSSSSSEEEESDSEENSGRRKRRGKKKFVMPPPRELPQRTTRGKKVGALAIPEDDDADEDFWNQEFFADEEQDEAYETESEPEDKFDQDFLDSEDEDEEDGEDNEAQAQAMEPKKKILKPPGYKKQVRKKPPGSQPTKKVHIVDKGVVIPPERTMSVRNSTRRKVEDAKEMRKIQEGLKSKKSFKPVVHKQLTQAELLAEAARTEIENIRSLQYLEAVEEENKKRANATKSKYIGPMISFKSIKNGEGYEQSSIEVRNMKTPEYLEQQVAPPPPEKPICPITKLPAKYRDPVTGQPYATLEAFKKLRAECH
ncbi:SWR1 complex subunit 2 [Picochlorum sp. SENEW3]|nr:SWR1 complex subunit 2 [Picochlorum sp. SENEW3]